MVMYLKTVNKIILLLLRNTVSVIYVDMNYILSIDSIKQTNSLHSTLDKV